MIEDSGEMRIDLDQNDEGTNSQQITRVPGKIDLAEELPHDESFVDPQAETLWARAEIQNDVERTVYIPSEKAQAKKVEIPNKEPRKPSTTSPHGLPAVPVPPEMQKAALLRKLEQDFLSQSFETNVPAEIILEILDYFENSPEYKDADIEFVLKTFTNKLSRGLSRITSGMMEKLNSEARELGILKIQLTNPENEERKELRFTFLFNGKNRIEILATYGSENQNIAEKALQVVKKEIEAKSERKAAAIKEIELAEVRKEAIKLALQEVPAEINKANFGNRNYSFSDAVNLIRKIQKMYPPKVKSDHAYALVKPDKPLGTLKITVEGKLVEIHFFYNESHEFFETFNARDILAGRIYMAATE